MEAKARSYECMQGASLWLVLSRLVFFCCHIESSLFRNLATSNPTSNTTRNPIQPQVLGFDGMCLCCCSWLWSHTENAASMSVSGSMCSETGTTTRIQSPNDHLEGHCTLSRPGTYVSSLAMFKIWILCSTFSPMRVQEPAEGWSESADSVSPTHTPLRLRHRKNGASQCFEPVALKLKW